MEFKRKKPEIRKEKYKKYEGHIKRRERSGLVFKGCHLPNLQIVDLKEVHFLDTESSDVDTEISCLRELDHRNIVKLLDVETRKRSQVDRLLELNPRKRSVFIVLERMDMTLKTFMDSHPDMARIPLTIKKYLYQILSGVAHCHSRNILHHDIKPQSILIHTRADVVKLSDFGLARTLDASAMTTRSYTSEFDESLWYSAPELLLLYPCSAPFDMWSVGCVFAEMVNQRPLFSQQLGVDQLTRILSILGTPTEQQWPEMSSWLHTHYPSFEPKNLADVVPGLDPSGLDLLSRMLWMDPSGRITAADALNHPYLNQQSMM